MLLVPLYLALVGYAAASVLAVWYVRTGADRASRQARRVAAVGFAAHTLFLVAWGLAHGELPAYSPFEALIAFLWCAALVYLILGHSLRLRALPAFVLPIIAACGVAIVALVPAEAPAAHTVKSWWVGVHAVSSLLGAADFLVAFAAAVMYLVQQRQLKRKSVGPLMTRMPSLDALDRLNYRAISLGMPVFTLALISGVVLSVHSKGPGWWASPTIAGSLLAWVLYATLLHVRMIRELRGPKIAHLTIAAFLLVALVLGAIAFLGDTVHTMRSGAVPARPRPPAEASRDAP